MIIGAGRTYALAEFVAKLTEAGRGTLRVVARDHSQSTGWLVTDQLLLVPAFAVGRAGRVPPAGYLCWPVRAVRPRGRHRGGTVPPPRRRCGD